MDSSHLDIGRTRCGAPSRSCARKAGKCLRRAKSTKCAGKAETTTRFLGLCIVHFLVRGRFRQFSNHLLSLGDSIGGTAEQISILYAVAMGVDALAALVVGKAYDKIGFKALVIIPFATLPLPFLAFSQQYSLAFISVVLWGGGYGGS